LGEPALVDDRMRRVGLNEVLFREVNEEIRSLTEEAEQRPMQVLCECGNETCIEELPVGPDDYERVRADGALFILASGHESPEVEEVVESTDGFNVVRKHAGAPVRLAEARDPRT